MISFLNGKIILKKDKFIILEVNNIGYKVFLSRQTLLKLPEIISNLNPVRNSPPTGPSGASTPLEAKPLTGQGAGGVSNGVKLFCFHNIKEDVSDLYGFLTYDELEFFETLMEIRGVGPKSALDIASLGSLAAIKDRILKQDEKIFAGIPGIGLKKAQTIILELTGKIKLLDSIKHKASADPAEDALTQLGFSHQQAKEALKNVPSTIKEMEERIKLALKNLGK